MRVGPHIVISAGLLQDITLGNKSGWIGFSRLGAGSCSKLTEYWSRHGIKVAEYKKII